jgi:hypothetical protein
MSGALVSILLALSPSATLSAGANDSPAPAPLVRPATQRASSRLRGAVRCVWEYLEAVRLAAPAASIAGGRLPRLPHVDERRYAEVRRLTAPHTLSDIDGMVARDVEPLHPMAPWTRARRHSFLLRFQILSARRVPRDAVVVAVSERYFHVARRAVEASHRLASYLVAPVGGSWRVVDRRSGLDFPDEDVDSGYSGYWDDRVAAQGAKTVQPPIPTATATSNSNSIPTADWTSDGLQR